jgi:hypothetical protein
VRELMLIQPRKAGFVFEVGAAVIVGDGTVVKLVMNGN